MSARLVSAAQTTRLVASGAVVVLALRFAIVAWGASGPTPAPAGSAGAAPDGSGRQGQPPTVSLTGSARAGGLSRSTRLSVLVAPDRAKVRVDGAERGSTPFFGDVTCLTGATVVIEVEAPGGKTQRFERTCSAEPMKVE
jgi:hypothetical protein